MRGRAIAILLGAVIGICQTCVHAQEPVDGKVLPTAGTEEMLAELWPLTLLTNATQLAEQFSRQDVFYLPSGFEWDLHPTDWQPWYFAELPWLADWQAQMAAGKIASCRYPSHYGVEAMRVTLTLDLLTGDLTAQSACSGEELARYAAPKDYQPGQWPECEPAARLWQDWQQAQKEPSWAAEGEELPFPVLRLHARLADWATERPVFEKHALAELEEWLALEAAGENETLAGGGEMMLLMMDGEPCETNEYFRIEGLEREADGEITIRWCGVSNWVYQVQAVAGMESPRVWEAQALVAGVGYLTWTSTNNLTANTKYFLRVRGLRGDEDADNDGLSNMDEFWAGTDIDNPDTDGDGILDGFDANPLDPDIGPPNGSSVITLYNAFGVYTNFGDVYLQADARSTNGAVTIAAAEYYETLAGTNGGGIVMGVLDGTFDSTNETVSGTFTPTFAPGERRVLWVHARGSDNQWSAYAKVIINPNATDILDKVQANYSAFVDVQFTATLTESHNGTVVSTHTATYKMKGPYKVRTEYDGGTVAIKNENVTWWYNSGLNIGGSLVSAINGDTSIHANRMSDFFWDVPLSRTRNDAAISNSVNSSQFGLQFTPKPGSAFPAQHARVLATKGFVSELDVSVGDDILKSEYLNPIEVMPGHWLHTLHRYTMGFDSGDEIVKETTITNIVVNQGLADSIFDIPLP